MKQIIELNIEFPSEHDNLDAMISELIEREEFSCTGNVACGAGACGVKSM